MDNTDIIVHPYTRNITSAGNLWFCIGMASPVMNNKTDIILNIMEVINNINDSKDSVLKFSYELFKLIEKNLIYEGEL